MNPRETISIRYGHFPADLADVPPGSQQVSPLIPGAAPLEGLPVASATSLVMLAPANTIERRAAMAWALRACAPGASVIVAAPNDRGGTRLKQELEAFGCAPTVESKRHHRIATTQRPEVVVDFEAAIEAGAPRYLPELSIWSQPGLFNWDQIDPGSQLLMEHLPTLRGRGADLGCGTGVLARFIAAREGAALGPLTLIDIDRRALAMAQRNVAAPQLTTLWADVRTATGLPTLLDFVVTNPPFHDGGSEDRALGMIFIAKAASMLRGGGVLWLTANRHLPYEATMREHFETVDQVAQAKGFKIYRAQKAVQVSHRKPSRRVDLVGDEPRVSLRGKVKS